MMEYKRIEELTTVVTGGTPSTAKAEFWEGGEIPWLQSGCCQNCDVSETEKFITQAGYDNSSAKLMPPDTVMIALTGATAGKIGYLKFEACGNQSITGILPCDALNQRFLFYYLLSQREKILADCIGGAQPHISQGYVKRMVIPVCSMNEQNRIVEKLSKLTTVIKARQSQLDLLDDLIKARFVELFGNGRDGACNSVFMGDCCKFQQGTQIPVELQEEEYKEGYKRFLRIIDYTQAPQPPRYVCVDGREIDVKSVVIVRYGATAGFVGRGYSGILANNLFEVVPDESVISKDFLYLALKYGTFERDIHEKAFGAAMPALAFSMMKDIPLVAPALRTQEEFVSFFEQVDKSKVAVQKSLDEAQMLFDSLMQQYFG